MVETKIYPRSLDQELARLDRRIAATRAAAEECANSYDRALNERALAALGEARDALLERRHGFIDRHLEHEWRAFCSHLMLAEEHFDKWASLAERR